jgi:L-ascorbate metabolism protein UlaG (beta-lactamase superfamily)
LKCLVAWLVLGLFSLAGQELEIRHVANAGVSLHCGEKVVLVDALFRNGVSGYETVPPALLAEMEAGRGVYRGVSLVVATHRHADHFDAESVKAHLAANAKAVFVGSSQTVGGVGDRAKLGTGVVEFDGGSVRLRIAPHNAPAGTSIENSIVDLRFCGKRLVFSGDAEVKGEWFAGLAGADWAFVPWWFVTGDAGRDVVGRVLKPKNLYALHGDRDSSEWKLAVKRSYPSARIGAQ